MNENETTQQESQDVEGFEQTAAVPTYRAADILHELGQDAAVPAPTLPGYELRFTLADVTVDGNIFSLERAHEGDAFDLRACLKDGNERATGVSILPQRFAYTGAKVIGTGLRVEIPEGFTGLVLPRSGIAIKHGVTLANSPGLIDPGYRGEVMLPMTNHGSAPFHVRHGDRLAQLLIVPAPFFQPVLVDELTESERGANGLGSTGTA